MEYPRLSSIKATRKTGHENFTGDDLLTGVRLIDFWQWSCSDLACNTMRDVLAEYLVALAVGHHHGARTEWDSYDVCTEDGIRIEVKSAAYVQSWGQKDYSRISYSVRPACAWDGDNGVYDKTQVRQADVYVFCLLHHKDQATINPMDVSQWTFFVLATDVLNRQMPDARTLSLTRLRQLPVTECTFDKLGQVIRSCRSENMDND